MTMFGKVLSVETRNLAEPAIAAAAVAATTLYVNDASTFDEAGGLISINGEVIAYLTTDVDLDTITLAAGLATAVADQDRVEVYPPTPIKTAIVDLGEEGGDSVGATVEHSLLDKLPDGTRDDSNAESVILEQRGIYDLVVSDLVGEQLVQQSLDYVEGEEGIGLSEAVAQVQDLNAIGQVNASGITVDTINLGGVDLATQLGATSVGKILSARLGAQAANIPITSTSTKIFELNCGTVLAGRTYRVVTTMITQNTGTLAMQDKLVFIYRYTLDGTAPTTSSATMDGGYNDGSYGGNAALTISPEAELDVAANATLRIGLFAGTLGSPAGSYAIYALTQARSRPVMTLYDDGPTGARQDTAITLTGGGVSRFVKTYNATWAFGVNADYGDTILDSYFHIGGESDSCGFVGFDSASMVAQLAGATTPVSCVVRWRPRTRQTSAGLDARLATHNFSSSTAAAAPSAGLPFFANSNLAAYGLTLLSNIRNNGVPGTSYEESLGTTVFNQFKAGSRKGVAFLGTPPASVTGGEGTVYGDGSYQVQLIFTYDGTS